MSHAKRVLEKLANDPDSLTVLEHEFISGYSAGFVAGFAEGAEAGDLDDEVTLGDVEPTDDAFDDDDDLPGLAEAWSSVPLDEGDAEDDADALDVMEEFLDEEAERQGRLIRPPARSIRLLPGDGPEDDVFPRRVR